MAFVRGINLFFFLYILLLQSGTFLNAAPGTPDDSVDLKSKLSKHPKLVVLSFDGFRYDFMQKIHMPNFERIREEGIYADSMRTRFPSKTFPNHVSMATGLYPESHGVVGNSAVYDAKLGRKVGPWENEFWNYRPDVAPIWIHNEWAGDGRYSGSNWAGSNFTYGPNNSSKPTYVFDYKGSYLSNFTDRMDLIIDTLTNDEKPANLLLMYFNEPDTTEHNFGPESSQTLTAIRKVDDAVGYLLERFEETGLDEEVNLIVLSDHGFQESSLRKVINLKPLFNNDWVVDVDITSPVFTLAPKDGRKAAIYQQLKDASKGQHFKVYLKEELQESWHFKHNDRRIHSIVVVADLGYVFDDYTWPGEGPDQTFGVHGYDNNASTMKAFFMAIGPAFKSGCKYPLTFSNVDVFPFMCDVIDLAPPPNNGTMTKIGVGLCHTTPRTEYCDCHSGPSNLLTA